jgi:hypothetical protein
MGQCLSVAQGSRRTIVSPRCDREALFPTLIFFADVFGASERYFFFFLPAFFAFFAFFAFLAIFPSSPKVGSMQVDFDLH